MLKMTITDSHATRINNAARTMPTQVEQCVSRRTSVSEVGNWNR